MEHPVIAHKLHRLLLLVIVPAIGMSISLVPPSPEHVCVIAGRILNELTGEPLESANAFLAGTTIGTSSGPHGKFLLRSVLTGGQDLVISLVGYDRRVIHLELTAGDSTFLAVTLLPHVLQGEQIQVEASEPKEWKENLVRFEKVLFGEGEFADQCRLLNPYVVDLRLTGDKLVGRSDSLLRVENPALGYTIGVVIRRFEWDVRYNQGVWVAYVHFRESTSGSQDQREEWLDHRRSAYEGSLRHFFWALARRRLFEEGFAMRTGQTISSSQRWTEISEDSIHLMQNPGSQLLQWMYPDWVRIDLDFPSDNPGYIHLVQDHALIDSSGVLVTPLAFNLGGRWGRERLGSILPTDYFPETHP